MFVGIDVSKSHLDVAVRPSGAAFRVANDDVGIASLVEQVLGMAVTVSLVVMEASGGYEDGCATALALAGVPTAVVNPRQVRDFAKATGKLAKTDRLDADVIAHFGEALRPAVTPVDDEEARQLRELCDRRSQLVEMRTMESNRRRTVSTSLQRGIDKHIRWLDARIHDVEKDIGTRIRASPVWREKDELLRSAAGVGPATSARIIASLPELGRVGNKQIAALVGLAPFNDDSGTFAGKRHCRGGRADVRTALYMAALTAARRNPLLKAMYARMKKAGKPTKVVQVAVMRRLLVTLNAMMRDRTAWRSEAGVDETPVPVAVHPQAAAAA